MSGTRGIFVNIDGSSNGTTPVNARIALAGMIASAGAALAFRHGVFYDGLGNVVSGNTDTGTMSYSVRACQFALELLGTTASGAVVGANDAVFKATTTAAPGSNSRIDVIWVRQHAVAADGGPDANNIMEIGVTQGTAAASPTVPAIPTGAMALAQAIMPAGATSTNALTITQTHLWTAMAGAPVPVRNVTERTAMTLYPNLLVNRLDNASLEQYSGTVWNPITQRPRRLLIRTSTAGFATGSITAFGGWSGTTGDDGDSTGFTLSGGNTLTCDRAGLVHVQCCIFFGAAASGSYQVILFKNLATLGPPVTGGTQIGFVQSAPGASVGSSVLLDTKVIVAAGDTLNVCIQQTSGGSLTLGSAAGGGVYWNVERVDDA